MTERNGSSKGTLVALAAAVVVAGGAIAWQRLASDANALDHVVEISMPPLSGAAATGQALFSENCSSCHGENAVGGAGGPPLVHNIYEPNHHGDVAFHRAVQIGVMPHHWKFGAMPPVPHVRPDEVESIIAFVRTLQRANGIY
ncbi:MAG: cytochrome C [Hyphomicrobiales bacterium]|nr:MAG: cytochrome C [Hyphomicrobiales bacterium]